MTQCTSIFKSLLNVCNFTNVILQNMYVRIQASFLCKYILAVNVQNIHLQWMSKIYIRSLLCFSLYLEYNLCPRLIHQWKCWNGLTFLFVFVLESAFLEVLQFAHFYAKGVVLRNNHWLIDGLRHHFKSACNTILGVRATSL